MGTERNVALKFAIRGLRGSLLERPGPTDLTAANATDVVRRGLLHQLQQSLDAWEATGQEPDWFAAIAAVPTDGTAYIGPTGGWIEFDDADAELIGLTARREVNWTRKQLAVILRALGGTSEP